MPGLDGADLVRAPPGGSRPHCRCWLTWQYARRGGGAACCFTKQGATLYLYLSGSPRHTHSASDKTEYSE